MNGVRKIGDFIAGLFEEKREGRIPVGVLILAGFVYIYFNPYFPKGPNKNPNESSRMYLTNAIVTRGEMAINDEIELYGDIIDKSKVGDKFYSDKAPGMSLLAVPPVFIYHRITKLFNLDYDFAMSLYFAKLFTLVIPALLLLFLLYSFISDFLDDKRFRLATILSCAFGSLIYPFTVLFFSHALAAALSFFAFYTLNRAFSCDDSKRLLLFLLAGALAGLALIVEYPAVIVISILGVWLIAKERSAKLIAYPLGALPFIAALLIINNALFGSPFSTGYSHLASSFAKVHLKGFVGVSFPQTAAMWELLFGSSRGLFPIAPHLALGVAGSFLAFRHKKDLALLLIAIIFLIWLFHSSFGHWEGGWTLGPRHLTILMPFLTIGFAFAAKHIVERRKRGERLLLVVLTLISVLVVSLSTLVFPYFPPVFTHPVSQMTAPLLAEGLLPDGIARWIGVEGFVAVMPWILALSVALYLIARASYQEGDGRRTKALFIFLSLTIALAIAYGKLTLGGDRADEQQERLEMIIKDYK
ncbi:MAG: hypothetical protein Kow0090_16810 [Myxococcota bacterium]